MLGLRTAAVACVGIVSVPTITFAQAQTQFNVLTDAMALCSDTTLLPADWPDALVGWDAQVQPSDALINTYLASDLYGLFALDGEIQSPLSSMDQIEVLAIFQEDFEWGKADVLDNPDDQPEAYFTHSTGWTLVLNASEEEVAYSDCTLWHMDPDPEVMEYLSEPYLGYAPMDIFLGTLSATRLDRPDRSGFSSLDITVMTTDPAATVPAAVLDTHPLRFLPPISVGMFFSAFGRESL